MNGIDSLQFTVAGIDDVPCLLTLYASLDQDPAAALPLASARERFLRLQAWPGYRIFLARDPATDRVVGTYTLLVIEHLAHGGTPSAVVENVVVDPGCQRQGIGRRMMAHAVQQARAAGCYKLALSSNSRRAQAHAFYRSLGFSQHGISFLIEP